ncbi:MAG: stage 0 sporulation family protein [Firmicutes bacterium]|nr:stage 0 sporulation family protein [Bacillota bacterium]
MPIVIGVRFRRAGKVYHFDPGEIKIDPGAGVIVETARGLEMGEVVFGQKELPENELVMPLKKVLRIARDADYRRVAENKKKEDEALPKCQTQIERHSLNMKLVGAEYTFDRNKVIFYFTSDERVDFRELVKDLAAIFRTRIELRQIGVRDEAKLKGGIGPCGRSFCCTSFLEDFSPVSIRMAKDQNLSLNPTKISGVCGRLMCCLRFEMSAYEEARGEMPLPGEEVLTPDGEGKVTGLDRSKKIVRVKLRDSGCIREFPAEEVEGV